MEDLKYEMLRMADESPIQRDGSVRHVKRVDFMIGKFGPFSERYDKDTFTALEHNARVEKLRSEIRMMQ